MGTGEFNLVFTLPDGLVTHPGGSGDTPNRFMPGAHNGLLLRAKETGYVLWPDKPLGSYNQVSFEPTLVTERF